MLRRRRNTSDHVYPASPGVHRSASPPVLLSGHRDSPISRRARLYWWTAGSLIVVALVLAIALLR